MTFDTSASLTLSIRSTLSSGLFGADLEAPWRLARACRKIFHDMTAGWHDPDFELTDFRANEVIASGSTQKLLAWKQTSIFSEALRNGHDEVDVMRAFSAATTVFEEFDATYKPLLSACQRRIHFFQQETKLRWCKSHCFPLTLQRWGLTLLKIS